MTKSFRTTASMLATALAFVATITGVNAQSATADTPSLTYSQFQATQGFTDLSAAAARSATYLATLQGMSQTMNISEFVSGFSVGFDAQIAATRTASSAHVSVSNGIGPSQTVDYFFQNGSYLQSIVDYLNGDVGVNNASAALARLGKKSATMVITPTPPDMNGVIPIDPATLFSPSSQDPLFSLLGSSGVSTDNMLFSDVTSAPSQSDAQSTTYTYSGQLTLAGLNSPLVFNSSLTFNADGFMTAATVDESAGSALTLNISVTQAANNAIVLNMPVSPVTVSSDALAAMSTKIDIEIILTPRAKAIAAKAKLLAKKAKTATTAAKLIAAAKALKYKYTAVKNGVKVSAKMGGSTGSMCVTALKGKIAINHC